MAGSSVETAGLGTNVSSSLPVKGCGNVEVVLSDKFTWLAESVSGGADIVTLGKATT